MRKRKIAPSERMRQELMSGLVSEADPLGEAARRGAQLILQRALGAEVSDFLGRERYESKRTVAGLCGLVGRFRRKAGVG